MRTSTPRKGVPTSTSKSTCDEPRSKPARPRSGSRWPASWAARASAMVTQGPERRGTRGQFSCAADMSWFAAPTISTRCSGGHAGRLADLDQVPVGVAQVAADLPAVDLGWGEELGPPRAPLLIDGLDIGHPEVEEGAGPSGIGRWFQHDLGLVIGRSATDVDDHPTIGHLADRWLPVPHPLPAEHPGVEVPGAGHVRGHDEMGQHEPFAWGREVLICHW